MLNIVEKVSEYYLKNRRSYAPRWNYASSAGHPCARKLVYERLNWQEKPLPEVRQLLSMSDGNVAEKQVIKMMEDSGLQIVETQRPLEWAKFELSGRIEGQIKHEGKLILFEIKLVPDYVFEAINTQEQLKMHGSWWIRGYYDQFQIYLFLLEKEQGIFILKSRKGGIKQVDIAIDYEHAEKCLKKLEIVNRCVKEGTYPDRIKEKGICNMCDFKTICLPNEESETLELETNQEVTEILDEMEKRKEGASEYEKLNERWKKIYKAMKDGLYLVGGKYQVQVRTYERTEYSIPPEIKSQYKQKIPIIKAEVVKIQ